MNDSELEDQLRTLRPAAPSARLEERVRRELSALAAAAAPIPHAGVIARGARESRAWRWWRDLGWAVAGAAAALAAGVFISPRESVVSNPSPAPAPEVRESAFEPAGSTSELLAAEDSGQLLETTEGPVREVRYSFRERHAWTNPQTGARMEIEVPRQDVYLVPVSLQ